MIGLILGSLCLAGFVKTVRGGCHGGACSPRSFGGGCGPRPFGGCGRTSEFAGHHGWGGHLGGRGFGMRGFGGGGDFRRMMLRAAFAELGTTVAQEKELLAAVEKMEAARKGARDQAGQARNDLATLLRNESFDEVATGELLARVDSIVDDGKKAGLDLLATAHRVLDAAQREKLAAWVSGGFRPGQQQSPYRGGL